MFPMQWVFVFLSSMITVIEITVAIHNIKITINSINLISEYELALEVMISLLCTMRVRE